MHSKKTTKGWDISVEWCNGLTSWLPLKDIKDSNPLELAQYAIANKIERELAFLWWVPDLIRCKDRIIGHIKSKYWKTTHKFGIKIPKSVEHALEIDCKMGTDHWRRAIEKEMKKVRITFEHWNGDPTGTNSGSTPPIGFQEIHCHMIFNVKMDGEFTRQACFVAGGHMMEVPSSSTYSSVVSRESI